MQQSVKPSRFTLILPLPSTTSATNHSPICNAYCIILWHRPQHIDRIWGNGDGIATGDTGSILERMLRLPMPSL